MDRDIASECFDALVGAFGITAEGREFANNNTLNDEQALQVVLERRWGHLPEREAHLRCAARYGVELPA